MAIATKIHSPVDIDSRKTLGVRPGDTVRVYQKIEEKGKTRLQLFEGLVLACKHGNEPGATFTVRKVSGGVGVEKIFPLYSPAIDKIEIVKRARVRRAKLYYIREKVAREIRRQMRNMRMVSLSTESEVAKEEKPNENVKDDEAVPEGASEAGDGQTEVKEGDGGSEESSAESPDQEEK